MCILPVKPLSKVQNIWWNYDTADSAIFGGIAFYKQQLQFILIFLRHCSSLVGLYFVYL